MHEVKDDLLNSSGDHPHANDHPQTSGFIGSEVHLIEQEKYVLLLFLHHLFASQPFSNVASGEDQCRSSVYAQCWVYMQLVSSNSLTTWQDLHSVCSR